MADADRTFLDDTRTAASHTETTSGLMYKVLEDGDGKQPTRNDTVLCHYKGSLVDGTEFDSSYKRGAPARFPVNALIPGFTEGLELMKTGSKYEFVIPSEIGYGAAGAGGMIPGGATLIFEVELIDIL